MTKSDKTDVNAITPPTGKVKFVRRDGGYYDAYGNRITTEMLMKHPHEIIEDEGWIDFR